MPIDSLDAEDALVPLAEDACFLYFFSRSDGLIYQHDSGYRQIGQTTGRGVFAVPGDALIYRVTDTGRGYRFSSERFASSQPIHVQELDIDKTFRPTAVILGMGDRWAVFQAPDTTNVWLLSLHAGVVRRIAAPAGATPLMVGRDGLLVQSLGDRWGYAPGPSANHHSGKIVSVGVDSFIALRSPKDRREFTLVSDVEHIPLIPPRGWEVQQAAVHQDGFVATCLNPNEGFGVWGGAEVIHLEGQLELFSLGGHAPVLRQTGNAIGSRWFHSQTGSWAQGYVGPNGEVSIKHVRLGMSPCTLLTASSASRSLVISLHGGPDSHEWDGLRYGGLYSRLAAGGTDTLVVNYPGSRGFGLTFQQAAWERWDEAIAGLADQLFAFVRTHGYEDVRLMGVSFGAWVALQLGATLGPRAVVCASPVLDLTSHLRTHATDAGFSEWSQARFGTDLSSAQRGDAATTSATRVTVIAPVDDSAVDPGITAERCRERGWRLVSVAGGHYPRLPSVAQGRWQLLYELLSGE